MLASTVRHSNRLASASIGWLILLASFCLPISARKQEKSAQPLKQDEACLACHGQPDLKSEKGANISIRAEKHAASVHGILACKDCHANINDFPHPAKISKVQCASCHAEQAVAAAKSIHGASLGESSCTSCHGNVHEILPAAKLQPAKCAECHAAELKEFAESVHGRAAKAGDPDAQHALPATARSTKFKHPVRSLRRWRRGIRQPLAPDATPTRDFFAPQNSYPAAGRPIPAQRSRSRRPRRQRCSHLLGLPWWPRNFAGPRRQFRISHWNVAQTCGNCHKEIARTSRECPWPAIKNGVQDAPDCTTATANISFSNRPIPLPQSTPHTFPRTLAAGAMATLAFARYDLPADAFHPTRKVTTDWPCARVH